MNRYVFSSILLAICTTHASGQYPISGSFPPWASGSVPTPSYSPRQAPILTQPPVVFMVTDQVFTNLKGIVPDAVLAKLVPLKGKEYSQRELMVILNNTLNPEDVAQWKEYIFYSSQISLPKQIMIPAGKPLVGFYKMDSLLVGADGLYPFDSGEYNRAGFAGNARIYGTFEITLPAPDKVDPINRPIFYHSIRGPIQCLKGGFQK